MKKSKFLIMTGAFIIVLVLSFLIGTGLRVRTDVFLVDYSLSQDSSQLTFRTAIPTSMGYIRGFKDVGGGVKPHYITFYSTFGGLNSSFGAKNEFVLDLDHSTDEIYFNRPGGGYELVLQRNRATGEWIRPSD